MADHVHPLFCSISGCIWTAKYAAGYPVTRDNILCRYHARQVRREQKARQIQSLTEEKSDG